MAVKQVYNNFFIGPLIEMSGTTMNEGCVYLASDTQEMYGVDENLNLFMIGGADSEDKNFVHTQGIPSDTWVINHELNKFPSIQIFDDVSPPNVVEGAINHVDINNVILTFSGAFSGKAILN